MAYYVSDQAQSAERLRAELGVSLPEYMLPSAYVHLNALPLTANGKIDRNALPAPDLQCYATRAYEAPQGETEQTLATIWQSLLKIERVGRHDNFFELGGHSLSAAQAVERVRLMLTVEVPLRTFFAAPTIAQLTFHIDTLRHAQFARAHGSDAEDLFAQVAALSDDEVAALLKEKRGDTQ